MSDVVKSWDLCAHDAHNGRRRQAQVRADAIAVEAIDREDRPSPWTRPGAPLALPDHVAAGSLRIHAVVPHEWSTDLVVEFRLESGRRQVEMWRLSPVRILAVRRPVPGVVGKSHEVTCQPPGDEPGRHRLHVLARDDHFVHRQEIVVSAQGWKFRTLPREPRRYDLFVSYKSAQQNLANQIVARLIDEGVDVWYAPLRHKAQFAVEMPALINATNHVLVLWSHESDERWEQASKAPSEAPYVQAHEIVRALHVSASKNMMVCLLDAHPVHEELRAFQVHRFSREEAALQADVGGGDLDDQQYAEAIADYVLTAMRKWGYQ